jgi:hypothetical protein
MDRIFSPAPASPGEAGGFLRIDRILKKKKRGRDGYY